MKRTMLLTGIVLAGLLIPGSLFAGGKIELSVTNNTGAVIQRIQLTETDNSGFVGEYDIRIDRGGSATINVKKNTSYDVVLIDTAGHKYLRSNRWNNDAVLVFNKKDFVHESFWRTLGRALPFGR